MKYTRKIVVLGLLIIGLVLILTACGCEHEWAEATCLAPKTCNLCGATSGDIAEHNYMEANCDNPKRCSFCDATEGKSLGHDYVDGYCTICYQKDPSYIDLGNIGFSNTYGMNAWLEISGYDFSKNMIIVSRSFYFQIYCGNYWQYGSIPKELVENITSVNSDSFESLRTEPYTPLSNDVIQYNGATGWGPVTIIGRSVSPNNRMVVIKTKDQTTLSGSREEWYVPADLLDFSTTTEGDEEGTYFINYK